MTVTKAELDAREIVDNWIGQENVPLDTQERRYWSLIEKVQATVVDRDLMKKHADEGWKLANQRTAERQEVLGCLRLLLDLMDRNIPANAAREAAVAIIEKFKLEA
jgi:hypothetical protein